MFTRSPEKLYRNESLPKPMLREALSDILPDKILNRPGKADFSDVSRAMLLNETSQKYFEDLSLYDLGWLKRREVCQMFDSVYANQSYNVKSIWNLWAIHSANQLLENA